MTTPIASMIFAVINILHFSVNVISLAVASECHLTLFAGLSCGCIYVPTVLLLLKLYNRICVNNTKLAKVTLGIATILSSFVIGCATYGINKLNAICPERLLFMAYIHGVIIPGVIVSCASIVKSKSYILSHV